MAKGISSVKGNRTPKVGEENFYEVATYYRGTPALSSYNDIKWKLYAEESSGRWRELRGIQKTGKRVPYSFPQKWQGKKLLIEAYIHSPEIKAPPGIIITPVRGEPKIESIGFFDSNWKALKETPKYGQTVYVRINTINMFGETLQVSLWERDTYSDTGHDESENTNVWDSEKLFKITNTNGRVEFKMPLDIMWKLKADKGIWDVEGSEHEYYLLVKGKGAQTKYSPQQNVKDENAPVEAPVPARNPSSTPEPSPSPAPKQEPLPVKGVGPNPAPQNDGVSPSEVKEEKVEGITDAYFAKKEYTKQSGKESGTADYIVGSNGNKTKTDADKEKIAKIILGRVNAKSLKDKKEYTTLAAIKAGLTKDIYNKNEKVTFKTYKLEAEFVRVSSAPLEAKLYLVAKAYFLDGKNAKIIVKEKDGLIKGSANAILPILEIMEADMEQTSSSGEVKGTEKTEFTGVIKDGMIKIPIHLRPKSDENLKIWKDKLAKGIKDGDYNYTFGSSTSINDEKTKKNIAGIILKNAISGNVKNKKIADGKIALVEDIEKALTIKTYEEGATIKFPTYKKQAELLYLNAKATGTKQHDKEFLKSEGEYFEVAKKCPRCEAEITLADIEDLYGVHANSTAFRKQVVEYLNRYIKQRNSTDNPIHINTCLRKAHFFAQVGAETLGINTDWIVETDVVPYAPSNIGKALFGDRSVKLKNRGQVDEYCRERPQVKLLSFLYAAENGFGNGNGNEASQDGYKYRGRGLKQLTGRGNYRVASETLKEIFPDEFIDLEAFPDKVKEAKYAVLSALAYWEKNKVWKVADEIKTSDDESIKKIRRTVNGGTAGWKDAKKYFEKGILTFKVNECEKDKVESNACTPDCSQCFNYQDVWANPVISSDNGGKNNNRYNHGSRRGHKGIDIISGATYKDVHSLMCGTVEAVVSSFSTNQYKSSSLGNVINIKSKDKNGNTVYILYCHLDRVNVTVGQAISHGTIIGKSGSTGNAAQILDDKGKLKNGIYKENWHCHIEATSQGAGLTTFFGKDRLQPEDYMKTKFDENGNAL